MKLSPLAMNTEFPKSNEVSISLKGSPSIKMKVRVRIPSWAEKEVKIEINKTMVVTGKPGSYITIDRIWHSNDVIRFALPMNFSLHKYAGLDQDRNLDRYALEYGPVLMALVGDTALNTSVEKLCGKLTSRSLSPLQFDIEGKPDCKYIPYYLVQDEKFTCFPTVEN